MLGFSERAAAIGGVVVALRVLALVILLANRAYFSARDSLVQNLFGVYSVLVFLVCATALTLRRGARFDPEISDAITALYFVVVTLSSVGFGDITPRDSEARGFVLILIAVGGLVLTTAVSVFLIPIISGRLNAILRRQENPVNRTKHFVVIGTSPLARNATAELEKRGKPSLSSLVRRAMIPSTRSGMSWSVMQRNWRSCKVRMQKKHVECSPSRQTTRRTASWC
jgi:voltage-gated potassium channel